MEETLGRRIAANRKSLSLTQDALAEKLGVTAQAVSKWENDQSCPDITMLPKLADIFDCTTDELLGRESRPEQASQILPPHPEEDRAEPNGIHIQNGDIDIQWDGGRRSGLVIAVWLFLTGLISVIGAFRGAQYGLWNIAACCAIFSCGIFGFPGRFTFLRLGCILAGVAFLINLIREPSIAGIDWTIPIGAGVALLGLDLLIGQFRKQNDSRGHILNGTVSVPICNRCTYGEETFDCSASFGEQRQLITLSRLTGGKADQRFGELVVDLSGCEEIADGCVLELNCSFGELELLIPRSCRIEPNISTSFASFDIKGSPAQDASVRIYVNGSSNFGNITLRYL